MLDTPKSRSQKKRESTALQNMGEKLCLLSEEVLQGPCLTGLVPDDLLQAVLEYRATKTHEARRRQMQYVGRMMREVPDIAALEEAIENARQGARGNEALLQEVEGLRAVLLGHDLQKRTALLAELSEGYEGFDSKTALDCIAKATGGEGCTPDETLDPATRKKRTKASRDLFRHLRGILERNQPD